jgi:diacylglycerol kinase (ATP)
MEATLIYNASAGANNSPTAEELLDALLDAGFNPVHKPTTCVEDLEPILEEAEGLVVSAGGDGTARAVILRLLGRDNLFFTPLPMGTANNICQTLGISGNPLDIIKGLSSPRTYNLDIGQLSGPWGVEYFIEGAGIGFFAEMLASYAPEQGKSVLRSAQSLIDVMQNGFARESTLYLPDKVVEGEFLIVEALNTTAIGPRLKFAPDADPSDGLLNIVCIRANQREGYLSYLRSLLAEELYNLDSVETYQVPEFRITWHGFPVHIDAELYPEGFDFRQENEAALRPYPDLAADAILHICSLPGAIHAWLPAIEEP